MQKTHRNNYSKHLNRYQTHNQNFPIDNHNLWTSSIAMWPLRQQLIIDGWMLCFFYPFTYRCNCIYPLKKGRLDILKKIKKCEQLYMRNEYGFVFQILPKLKKLDFFLKEIGYKKSQPTRWMSIHIKKHLVLQKMVYQCNILSSDEWLDCRQKINGYSEKEAKIYKHFHQGIVASKYPFVLMIDNLPISCGLGIQVGNYLGIFDIRTKDEFQRQGYAKNLIQAIMMHAYTHGATHAQLHVDLQNIAATTLYQNLGFKHICDYWFRKKGDSALI